MRVATYYDLCSPVVSQVPRARALHTTSGYAQVRASRYDPVLPPVNDVGA